MKQKIFNRDNYENNVNDMTHIDNNAQNNDND